MRGRAEISGDAVGPAIETEAYELTLVTAGERHGESARESSARTTTTLPIWARSARAS